MFRVGLDLRFFEDWRDGAYLDCSDSKLIEQFDGNSTIQAARAEVGGYDDAVATVKKAIILAEEKGLSDFVAKAKERLAGYETGRPYHEQ